MHIAVLKKRDFLTVNIVLLVFSLVLIISSWTNRDFLKLRDPLLASLVFVCALVEFYLLMEITAIKGCAMKMTNIYYYLSLIIVIISDALIFLGIEFNAYGGEKYLVGTKFALMYAHFWLMALYATRYMSYNSKKKKSIIWLLVGLTLLISRIVDCSTGTVGAVFLGIILFIYRRNANILYNQYVFIGALMVSFVLSYMINLILLWEPVAYIITQILDRDITMTSRTKIFLMVPVLLKGHYLLGFGYGSSYELCMRLGGFVNTQNAVWEWIWQCGIVGTVLLLCLIFCVVRYANKANQASSKVNSKYLLLLLYLFSFLAIVEITIDLSYLAYLAMLIPLTYSKKNQHFW